MQLTLDFTEATRRKEAGMSLALAAAPADWESAVRAEVAKQRGEFLMETVRAKVEAAGFRPKSNNAYGALTNGMVREGLILWTGKYANTTSPKTHGHPAKTWVVK